MARHGKKDANRRFHDRVAARYDQIYDDPYWEFHDRVTWNHLKPYVPREVGAGVMDLGCGTGKWGLKLLKMGHPTTFCDLSPKMLEEVEKKLEAWRGAPDLAGKASRATVKAADAVDLRGFAEGEFALVTAMGDVVSICSDPGRCLSEVHRVLSPGGMFVFTVDNHLAAIDHFIASGNLAALADFVKTGRTEWLTRNVNEQFDVHMFMPGQIEALVRGRGFEVVSRIGKTVIPARQNRKVFEEAGAIELLVELEERLQGDACAAARASHLQLAVRRV